MILRIIGALGGRKFISGIVGSVLVPTLAVYLPQEIAVEICGYVTGLIFAAIASIGAVDVASKGATTTTRLVKKDTDENNDPDLAG